MNFCKDELKQEMHWRIPSHHHHHWTHEGEEPHHGDSLSLNGHQQMFHQHRV